MKIFETGNCITCVFKTSPIVCEISIFIFWWRFTLNNSQSILLPFAYPLGGMGFSACGIIFKRVFQLYLIYLKFYFLWAVSVLISQPESLCFDKCVWFNAFWPLPVHSFSAGLWILAGGGTEHLQNHFISVPTSNSSCSSAVFPKLSVSCLGYFRCFTLA